MRTERAEPILPSRDLLETRAFYKRLGFTPWWGEDRPWDYDIFSRGQLVVHFFAEPSLQPEKNDAGCYWRVEDADRLHAAFAALDLPSAGIPRLTAPADQPWGMREFTLVDPSGNLVRIGHDLAAEK
jgi:catechol 2,3-dioxygenase-like lactoylglutathione lyase family enzyme